MAHVQSVIHLTQTMFGERERTLAESTGAHLAASTFLTAACAGSG